jgi:hypothetical protein
MCTAENRALSEASLTGEGINVGAKENPGSKFQLRGD